MFKGSLFSKRVGRSFYMAGAAGIALSGGQALAAGKTHTCTASCEYRSVEVVEPGENGRACEVKYRNSETGPEQVLWYANSATEYCQTKADDLIARLVASGFDCVEGESVSQTSASIDGQHQGGLQTAQASVVAEQSDSPTTEIGMTQVSASGPSTVAAAPSAASVDIPVPKSNDGPIIDAIKNGKPIIDVRYRFETKSQAGFAEDAYANTIRTRLGFESGDVFDFKVLVEFENVTSFGGDDFNSTTNGMTMFPVIPDPDATEINRAQLTYTGIDKTAVTFGRQRFNLNNQRFVGAVDFRQNQQTFDAIRLSTELIDRVTLDYLYIDRVHRIFGDNNPAGEFDSNSHIISAVVDGGELGKVKAYGIILDLTTAAGLSSQSWGGRYENAIVLDKDVGIKLGVVAEYATQSDYAANPVSFREEYIHGEASLSVAPFTGKIGYEKLGGDGTSSFKTPLATLHKFQGFADVFLVTPASGLEDIYGTISYSWKDAPFGTSVNLFATYHDFQSDVGSLDLGEEFDAGIAVKFHKHWTVNVKGAVYNGGAFGPADRSLVWASLRFQY